MAGALLRVPSGKVHSPQLVSFSYLFCPARDMQNRLMLVLVFYSFMLTANGCKALNHSHLSSLSVIVVYSHINIGIISLRAKFYSVRKYLYCFPEDIFVSTFFTSQILTETRMSSFVLAAASISAGNRSSRKSESGTMR